MNDTIKKPTKFKLNNIVTNNSNRASLGPIPSVTNSKMLKNAALLNAIRRPFILKSHYNSVIPLNIYQTWHSKTLPPLMEKNVEVIKNNNPQFNYYLYDDNDCREFIKNNFPQHVLNAFDKLVPGAYKADLWRYCVLYKNGGIYLDIKYTPINKFRFIALTEKEHWVLDVDNRGIYNALIVAKAGNAILLKAINQIVKHVNNRFYGNGPLEVTGPLMLARFFSPNDKKKMDMHHRFYNSFNYRFIIFNNKWVFKSYNGYLKEHSKYQKAQHYSRLWHDHKIYRK
jgi:mannosyltransferase OCH1-like enzyme